MDTFSLDALVSGLTDANFAKEYAVASWALFVYEYFITFDQEVTNLWRTQGSYLLKVLWFFNRYTFFLSFSPTLLLSFVPLSPEVSSNPLRHSSKRVLIHYSRPFLAMFVKFPAAMQVILNASAGCTLILRTYALYACQKVLYVYVLPMKWILVMLLPVVAIGAAVESWALTMGVPTKLPPGVVGCILTGNPVDGDRFAFYWTSQLVFPTVIFGMTVARIVYLRREGQLKGGIVDVLMRDGVIYFAIIFIANLVNVVTFVTASQTVKQINAPFTEMIISVMICRIILNLRTERCLHNNSDEMSDFQCATWKERNGKISGDSDARSPTIFDSQVGTIGSVVDECESVMEFESASVVEGKTSKFAGRDGLV
ncbi:hypothetical protein SCHPADRAFT_940763 [Schizopora paradoxa]|uniref:DUF6533 domain-containing protein n=1 Tax=Schizopora paradoxa TaxID=27342 RepID=A0A0H2RU75_9AGAM|nr:hypothetical protein SCHPADRAFT_940763 [Schizopora paradoxa]